jgi:hypothetical protein
MGDTLCCADTFHYERSMQIQRKKKLWFYFRDFFFIFLQGLWAFFSYKSKERHGEQCNRSAAVGTYEGKCRGFVINRR